MEKKKNLQGRKVLLVSVLWAVTYIASLILLKGVKPGQTWGVTISFLPTITFALFLYHFIKSIGGMDEVERRVQLEAAVFGFASGLLLLMTLGLLDLVIVLNKEDWGYRHLIPYFFLFYLVGIFISKRKYS